MDEIRYFAATVAARDTGSGEFFALGVERGAF